MSFIPNLRRPSSVAIPLLKPVFRPLNSSFFASKPSILTRIPILGKRLAKRNIFSVCQPDVEITIRFDFRNMTSTISSKSLLKKGSPPVIFTNLKLGSISNSLAVISFFLSVGFFQISHILQAI